MERNDILALMGELKLYGMRTSYDEVMATGIKRQHEPPRIVGDLSSSSEAIGQTKTVEGRDRGEAGAVDQVSNDQRRDAWSDVY